MKINKPEIERVEAAFKDVLNSLNLDLNDHNLRETPKRLAKMYVNELFSGLYEDHPEIKTFESGDTNQGFLYTVVPFRSTCAHHFQPINGSVHIFVDYKNSSNVLGLSKFNRIVQHVANRPTLQETLTKSVFEELTSKIHSENIMVITEASHHCVTDRGVCAAFSNTVTRFTKSDSQAFVETCNTHFRSNSASR